VASLPDWCSVLADAEQMRAIDRFAIEDMGVPGLELMERAGLGVARAVEHVARDGAVCVVCGKGNNGGDGFVAARVLREAGRRVRVLCTAETSEYAGDARANLECLPGEPPEQLGAELPTDASVVVDALLGTGSEGAPRGAVARAIAAINVAGAAVVSVDVPSGVDASTGVIAAEAVRASVTASFQLAKPGLWIAPGKEHAGEVRVIDIGIPREALTAVAVSRERAVGLIEPAVLAELPGRGASSTKFSSGHVIVVGGSPGLTGAPQMTAHAAMRAGAGYVTACLPATLAPLLASAGRPEMMTRALREEQGSFAEDAVESALEASARGGALALGNGLGRSEGAVSFARELARRSELPMVLDADGLNAHAGALEMLAARANATVLTPHAGELGRLLELPSAEIERERLRHARDAAGRARAVVVLKGDDTLIAAPGGPVLVSQGGAPALATAGTGDVLAGVIAALLAAGLDVLTAAAAGVWMHGAAGREAARREGSAEGVIAGDVIAALPAVRGEGGRP
jgi:ADP-dependent NAD(P)H-hydrate dehydratase / NAD(P)H-hydrate epimerase